jgi:hypothetical protein
MHQRPADGSIIMPLDATGVWMMAWGPFCSTGDCPCFPWLVVVSPLIAPFSSCRCLLKCSLRLLPPIRLSFSSAWCCVTYCCDTSISHCLLLRHHLSSTRQLVVALPLILVPPLACHTCPPCPPPPPPLDQRRIPHPLPPLPLLFCCLRQRTCCSSCWDRPSQAQACACRLAGSVAPGSGVAAAAEDDGSRRQMAVAVNDRWQQQRQLRAEAEDDGDGNRQWRTVVQRWR